VANNTPIVVDEGRTDLISKNSQDNIHNYYLRDDETIQEGYARASYSYTKHDEALSQRIYDYVSKKWFMFASPVFSNAPKVGEKFKGMPISCFLTYVPDTLKGLIDHTDELRWMSVKGGGVGGHWSDVRSMSDVAPSPIPFLKTIDADMMAYRQGKTRKGSYASYMDVSHPDILEFVNMRIPTGDINRKCLNLHHAVNITDEFMVAVENNLDWNLIDPNDRTIRDTLKARELWELLLETRYRTGEPFLLFIDTAQRAMPQSNFLKLRGSNLCIEIMQPANEERSPVCCLSSINLAKWDEWKDDKNFIADLVEFLDCVMGAFIENAPEELSKSKFAAIKERSLGLGTMGYHSLLQSKSIPFASQESFDLNDIIFEKIKTEALNKSIELGQTLGIAEDTKDLNNPRRNANILAIAPNASSSTLLGVSPSIEPIRANAYVHRTRNGTAGIKNESLRTVLEAHGKNDEATWGIIVASNGSVQGLDFLTDHEKDVFKTAMEICQIKLIQLAARRQKWVCQSQSLNVFIKAKEDKIMLNKIHYLAWKLGVKSLYYLRTEASNRVDNIGQKVERVELALDNELNKRFIIPEAPEEESGCVACEG